MTNRNTRPEVTIIATMRKWFPPKTTAEGRQGPGRFFADRDDGVLVSFSVWADKLDRLMPNINPDAFLDRRVRVTAVEDAPWSGMKEEVRYTPLSITLIEDAPPKPKANMPHPKEYRPQVRAEMGMAVGNARNVAGQIIAGYVTHHGELPSEEWLALAASHVRFAADALLSIEEEEPTDDDTLNDTTGTTTTTSITVLEDE